MPFTEEDLTQIANAVSAALDHRFTALEQGQQTLEQGQQEIRQNVEALVRNEPEVALSHLKQHVVDKGTELEMDAIREGADSITWTYMKHGDKVLAVSAAHCAGDHPIERQESRKRSNKRRKTQQTDDTALVPSYDITMKEFLEVPRRLAPFVTRAFLLPGVIGNRHPRTHQDIVIVELQDDNSDQFTRMKGSNSIPVWRTIAGQSENINLRGTPLAGVGLASIIVRARTSVWDDKKRKILFHPDAAEGGHSGTLMFDLQQRETQLHEQVVGVFIGGQDPGGSVHPRGLVCPLPNFDNLEKYEVAGPPPTDFGFKLRGYDGKSDKPFMRVEGQSHLYQTSGRKQKSIYGVFVDLLGA